MAFAVTDPIAGQTRGTAREAKAYAQARHAKRFPDVVAYIDELFRLSTKVGLDFGVLFAQACLETGTFTSSYWENYLNPAGIGALETLDQPGKISYVGGEFTPITAARAHVVHMAVYVLGRLEDHVLKDYIALDPRYQAVIDAGYAGNTPTIAALSGRWAADLSYAQKICDHANRAFPNAPDASIVANVGTRHGFWEVTGGIHYPISQIFGMTEFAKQHIHPGGMYYYTREYTRDRKPMGHAGIDIGIIVGTPLYSACDGTVINAGGTPYNYDEVIGKNVPGSGELLIGLDNGDQLMYGHMRTITVKRGQRVHVGMPVGTSGTFNGGHVHVEYRVKVAAGVTISGFEVVDPYIKLGKDGTDQTAVVMPPKPVIYDIRNNADAARFGLTPDERDYLLGQCFVNRNGAKIAAIVIHVQDGNTPGSLDHWVNGENVQASATVTIQKDGSILKVIPEQHGPWTNGSYANPDARGRLLQQRTGNSSNMVSLTMECEGVHGEYLTPPQLNAAIWQIRTWQQRYGLTDTDIYAHSNIDRLNRAYCPGVIYGQVMDALGNTQPAYQDPVPVPGFDGTHDVTVNGIVFHADKRTVTANSDNVTCHIYATSSSPQARSPLWKGATFDVIGWVESESINGENRWWVSPYGTRVWVGHTEEKPNVPAEPDQPGPDQPTPDQPDPGERPPRQRPERPQTPDTDTQEPQPEPEINDPVIINGVMHYPLREPVRLTTTKDLSVYAFASLDSPVIATITSGTDLTLDTYVIGAPVDDNTIWWVIETDKGPGRIPASRLDIFPA